MRSTTAPGRGMAAMGALVGTVVLTGCAPSATVAGPAARPSAGSGSPQPSVYPSTSEPTGWPCRESAAGFALSLAAGVTGSPTPEQAARTFVLHGATPGFGDNRSVWIVQLRDATGASVISGRVRLDTIRVSGGGWVVDSGERCGS